MELLLAVLGGARVSQSADNVKHSSSSSSQERKINKELREQLQEKRNKGEKGWYIKNGQLVKGNFR